MSRRRLLYRTGRTVGPFEIVTHRRQRGYAIEDNRTGRTVWTEPHPNTGRPRACYLPTMAAAVAALATFEPTD